MAVGRQISEEAYSWWTGDLDCIEEAWTEGNGSSGEDLGQNRLAGEELRKEAGLWDRHAEVSLDNDLLYAGSADLISLHRHEPEQPFAFVRRSCYHCSGINLYKMVSKGRGNREDRLTIRESDFESRCRLAGHEHMSNMMRDT